MKLKKAFLISLSSILATVLFLSQASPANAQNTFGHGLHTYEQYRQSVESRAYWQNRDRGSSFSTPQSSYNTSQYLAEAKREREERQRKENAARAERDRWLALRARTIRDKGKEIVLDINPVPLAKIKNTSFVRLKGLWAVHNTLFSSLVSDFEYSSLKELDNSHIIVTKGAQVGVIDSKGILKVPLGKFRDVISTGELFIVKDHSNKFGALSFDGKLLRSPLYKSYQITEGFALFQNEDATYTLINKQGKVVSDGDEIRVTSPRFAFNKFNSRYRFFNPETGEELMNKAYTDISYYWKYHIILATYDGKMTALNGKGEAISTALFDKITYGKSDSSIWITNAGNKKGMIDILIPEKGFESLPPLYDEIYGYDRETGMAEVLLNGEKKQVPIKLYAGCASLSPFKLGYAKARHGKDEFFLTREGYIFKAAFDKVSDVLVHSNITPYGIVEKNGKKGYLFLTYDRNSESEIKYDEVAEIDSFSFLSKVKTNGKWGILYHNMEHYFRNEAHTKNDSRLILLCNYDGVDLSGNKTIFIKLNNKWGGLHYPWVTAAPQNTIPVKYDQINAVWYRSNVKNKAGSYDYQVIYYAKRGKSTDYYSDDIKMKNDPYGKDSALYTRIPSAERPLKWNQ